MRDEHGTTRLSWNRLRIAVILGTSAAGLVLYWSTDALAALVTWASSWSSWATSSS